MQSVAVSYQTVDYVNDVLYDYLNYVELFLYYCHIYLIGFCGII